jgi:hypothetical protein
MKSSKPIFPSPSISTISIAKAASRIPDNPPAVSTVRTREEEEERERGSVTCFFTVGYQIFVSNHRRSRARNWNQHPEVARGREGGEASPIKE